MAEKMMYGFPVLKAEEVLPYLKRHGIVPWRKVDATVVLEEHMKRELTPERRKIAERFAPKTEVLVLENPVNGIVDDFFRAVGKDWATVFAPLPNPDDESDPLIPLIGEWKHGCDKDGGDEGMTVVPPSGVATKADLVTQQPYLAAGKREFEEETGIELAEVIPLSEHSFPSAGRNQTARAFLFFGVPKIPVVPGPNKLDKMEHLKGFLLPLSEWRKFLRRYPTGELVSPAITQLALEHMGRIH